ncbi:MAG: Fe-S cluster assembly ATPase SufC [Deltaproteobacteria bacterium]|jgi:Fe-S cluster assembly ATP-binding protein|nr:Fe-S cluster assembly ATPase SufC [Deltaproteobacteria bacterium]MBT4524994.1 Fe-S cluster assembly ATPase SufC [Deltaproteobacteria bacterium]
MLKIKALTVNVEGKPVLNGVNLNVNPGEVHAIMGPNGSGKSTLSNVLAGKSEYQVISGKVQFSGNDFLTLSPEERALQGLFLGFQYPVEIPGVSTENFLRTALNEKLKYEGKEELDAFDFQQLLSEKLQQINMDKSMTDRSLNQGFSGGEKKRNEILQMLVLDPKLTVLDEIDSGLDIDALKQISLGINQYKSEKNAVILVTHYQRLLNYITPDFVHVLMNGRIVMSGDYTLAQQLEEKGYEWIQAEPAVA